MMQEVRNLYYGNLTCADESDGSWEYKLQGNFYSPEFSYI